MPGLPVVAPALAQFFREPVALDGAARSATKSGSGVSGLQRRPGFRSAQPGYGPETFSGK
jgi:hypothetical protein